MSNDRVTEVAQNAPNNGNASLSVQAFELMEKKHPECKPTVADTLLTYGDQMFAHGIMGVVVGQGVTKNAWAGAGLGLLSGLLSMDSADRELKGRELNCLRAAELRDEKEEKSHITINVITPEAKPR